MADVWSFGEPVDSTTSYSDGTVVPHRDQVILFNGQEVGYVEIHMHRRKGDDKITDASVGITTCIYGPLPEGKSNG